METATDKFPTRLLAKGKSNPKLGKNDTPTWGLSLSPSDTSGYNVCPRAKNAGCIKSCIGTESGRGVMSNVKDARKLRTRLFMERREEFVKTLKEELKNADRYCRRKGVTGRIRLNVFSDIGWDMIIDTNAYPNLHFYDYTKVEGYALRSVNTPNYRRVYSYNLQTTDEFLNKIISSGGTVAVVFRDVAWMPQRGIKGDLPKTWKGIPVIDGDDTDDRFLDPRGVVVGLRLKGGKKGRKAACDGGFAQYAFGNPVNLTIGGK